MAITSRLEFERLVLPHLGAAYGLARWLLHHPQDAEDTVQDALLKSYKAFDGFSGGSARAWLLAIVRNTCLTALDRRRGDGKVVVLHDGLLERDRLDVERQPDPAPLADARLMALEDRRQVYAAVAALPAQFREVIVLREFHDLGYREISEIVGSPMGTVMSRLSRARERLKETLEAAVTGTGLEKKS